MSGDNVLINGFVVSGPGPKTVVVRALGPSLSSFGLSGVLADPVLTVYQLFRRSYSKQRQLADGPPAQRL